VLRGALTQAMREELVFRNVAALVRVPMPRSKRMPVWTVDQARQFLESAREDGDPMYAGYVLLLTLGLRRGEMLGLAWEDVDLEGGEALIAWQVQRVDGSLLRRHTKTPSSDAPLPLPEIAVQALERHRVEEARRRLAAGDMWGDCGLVFTTRLGDPVDPRNFHRDFKLRAAKAGVPVVPIHSTRRTCASLLVALDVHPRVAMAVLRHSRISLTMEIYSQVSSSVDSRDALKRLGAPSPLSVPPVRPPVGLLERRGAGRPAAHGQSQGRLRQVRPRCPVLSRPPGSPPPLLEAQRATPQELQRSPQRL
jgi:integrase